MSVAGWHPDPAGAPGRLRWWDGQAWTDHVHDPVPAPPPAPATAPGSPLDAALLVVGPPRAATPGCRVFELAEGGGSLVGRLVETSRGSNDSAFGARLSRSRGWQHATTRELRGYNGYPELVLAWGPGGPGVILVTLPDRRELGRLVSGDGGWSLVGDAGQRLGLADPRGVVTADGRRLTQVTPEAGGGWRVAVEGGPHPDPLRSLLAGAALAADML